MGTREVSLMNDKIEGSAYRMTNCEAGSAKYGVCECCGGAVDTTYQLISMRRYWSKIKNKESLSTVSGVFGHKNCLAGITNA